MEKTIEITDVDWGDYEVELNDKQFNELHDLMTSLISNYAKIGVLPRIGESIVVNKPSCGTLVVEVCDICYCDRIMYELKVLEYYFTPI